MLLLKIVLIAAAAVFLISFAVTYILLLTVTARGNGAERCDEEALLGRRRDRYGEIVEKGKQWYDSAPWEDVFIRADDGLRLHGHWLGGGLEKPAVILVHGYRSSGAVDFCGISEYYADKGFNILMIDQRSHGRSEGKSISFGVDECIDVACWARFAAERVTGAIYLHGVSMGGASVLLAASLKLPEQVKGVVADCPFTTPKEILAHQMTRQYHLPRFPFVQAGTLAGILLKGRGFVSASTVKSVEHSTLPLLLIGGGEDRSVPTDMLKEIYAAAAGEKTMLIVPEARHAVSYLTDPAAYSAALDSFFGKV